MSEEKANLISLQDRRNKKTGMKPEAIIYPDRISGARILAQFSIEQASRLTGITEADLELMESGLLTPDIEQLQALSLGLGFPVPWFYKPDESGWPGIEHTSLAWHKE